LVNEAPSLETLEVLTLLYTCFRASKRPGDKLTSISIQNTCILFRFVLIQISVTLTTFMKET